MILKIFTQPNCPKCPSAKELGKKLKKEKKSLIAYKLVSKINKRAST